MIPKSGQSPEPFVQPPRMNLDLHATLDEAMRRWLDDHAQQRPGDHQLDVELTGVVTVAQRGVDPIRALCADWDLSVDARPAGAQHQMLLIRGRTLPVQALCDSAQRLANFGI